MARRSEALACLSFLKRSRPAAGAGQTACLSDLSKKFCQGVAQEVRTKKKDHLSVVFSTCNIVNYLGDYLHVASMPNSPTITAQIIKKVIIVDSPTL